MRRHRLQVLVFFLFGFSVASQATELESFQVVKTVTPYERVLEGSVEAISRATASAETSGRVDEVLVDVGDHVPVGAVILKLLGIDQKENLNQATAALNEALTHRKAEAQQFERIEALYTKKLVSRANYDTATASYNSAKARVKSAEAALNRAKQQLSYTEIKAAFAGIVSARHVEVGEAVQPGTALMSGFDPDHLRVFVDLPQSIATQIDDKSVVRILLSDGSFVQPIKSTLFPTADIKTGTVRMRLELPEAVTSVYPGKLVKVAIQTGERSRLLVPESSIVYRSEVAGVYVLNADSTSGNQVPELRQIRIGNHFEDQVEILAGLTVNERVAVNPIAAGIVAASSVINQGN